ncbi:MAG: thioredoxin fold domain-containing protein [Thermosipho sp. (in: Bacteria)]|nr:thioredoxin fold domain-containing protein [Thermosipho sp. (in: thermotogales)]
MKKIIFSLLLIVSILSFSYKFTFFDLGTAHKISQIEDKPLIIYFSSPSCGYCKKFEEEVLSDKNFREILRASYIFVKINPNTYKTSFMGEEFTNMELFSVFGVRGTPTFVFWYKDKIITSIPGYLPLNDFSKALMYILRFTYENYQESFETYMTQEDFYLGPSEIIHVSKEYFDFVLENDKNAELIQELTDETVIDQYKTYLTYSTENAETLKEKGVLRILVMEEK